MDAWHRAYAQGRSVVAFVIEADGEVVGSIDVRDVGEHTGEITWAVYAGHRGTATPPAPRGSSRTTRWASLGYTRVQAKVEPENTCSTRVATRSGMRREGIRRVNRQRRPHGDHAVRRLRAAA